MPAKQLSSNAYKVKIKENDFDLPAHNQDLSSWDDWDGTSEITATNGYTICVAEVDKDDLCDKTGKTLVNSRIEYSITYMDDSSPITGLTPEIYVNTEGATLPTVVEKTGYDFDGWYATSALEGKAITGITTSATGNKTFYAKFVESEYTITYMDNDVEITGLTPNSYVFGIGATLSVDATKPDNTFDGWYDNVELSGDAVVSIGTEVTGNKTYYAKWTTS